MKKIISLFLAGMLVFGLVGCNSQEISETETEAGDDTMDNGKDEEVFPETLLINGVDVSEFRIVYSQNPMADQYKKYSTLVTQDTEYDEQTAEYLAQRLKECFGVELEVVKDTDVSATAHEINIGSTNRIIDPYSMSCLVTDKDYAIKMMSTGCLFLRGKTYGATWHSVDGLIDYIMTKKEKTVDLPADFSLEDKADLLVVACVGDSLTYGSKPSSYSDSIVSTSDRQKIVPYPMVLQRLEWKNMTVYNYGHGGRTAIEDFFVEGEGSRSYCDSPQYTALLENVENIDLTIMMLGTNDGNPTRTKATGYTVSTGSFKKKYISSCQNLVDAFKKKNGDVEIVMLNAPILFNSSWESNLESFIRKYQTETATQLGLTIYDMYDYTKTNLTKSDFPDSVHPTDEGYTTFAVGIDALIQPTLEAMLKRQ